MMNQPMQNTPMPAAAPASPMPQMPAPAAAGGAAPQQSSGPQRVSNTEFNQQVQNILLSRIEEEGTKNPSFGQAIEAALNPQAAAELGLIIPELIPILKAAGLLDGGESSQNITASNPAPSGYDAGQGSDNPLLRDGVSSGLVG